MSLKGEKLGKRYGSRQVVSEVDIEVQPGQIVGLMGPNGAGKTTTFALMAGLVRGQGTVYLDGRDVTRLPTPRRARLGMGYLPQETSVFQRATVERNLTMIPEALGRPRRSIESQAERLLLMFGLWERRDQVAASLSGGERRRLEIARTMMQEPRFVFLDEPLAGLDPLAVSEIAELILKLKAEGVGVLLTDHNVRKALELTDLAYVLVEGRILACGGSDELFGNETVRKFYLGNQT